MPYIEQHLREKLDTPQGASDAGELNFAITTVVHRYINYRGLDYKTLNDAIGALEAAKLELYRTVVAPYEDLKSKQNGGLLTQPIIPR